VGIKVKPWIFDLIYIDIEYFRGTGVHECRSIGVYEYGGTGVHEYRSTGAQESRSTGVEEHTVKEYRSFEL